MVKSGVGKNNLSPRSKRSVTWSAYLIQRCGQDVYDRLRFDSDAYANLHRVRVTDEVKGSKRKGFKFFDKCFYSSEQAKCWDVRLTIKLLIHIQKSAWLEAFGAPSQFFFARIPQGCDPLRTLHAACMFKVLCILANIELTCLPERAL